MAEADNKFKSHFKEQMEPKPTFGDDDETDLLHGQPSAKRFCTTSLQENRLGNEQPLPRQVRSIRGSSKVVRSNFPKYYATEL